MSPTASPLDRLPPPLVIHRHMGRLCRELALLRRLLRLSQAAHEQRAESQPGHHTADRQEVSPA
jgi:hypothetical protein